ncbi:MAG TPA: cytochrome c class I [Flavobacteriaceae bacterium]|jgi:mono/diheme cytochrome c family protein|nr:cytochrome c class I [Flavobacteriaceae bacterium]HBS11651.1 cytochrome c class I [Flavobacteriaceae bacterium]
MKKQLLYVLALITFIGVMSFTLQVDRWKAPEGAKDNKNPISTSKRSESALRGARIFKTRCMVCHGKQGKGDGIGGKALTPKPQNLTLGMVQSQTDGEIFWKITNGRNDMIKWGPILSNEQRWDVVNYVRTLGK